MAANLEVSATKPVNQLKPPAALAGFYNGTANTRARRVKALVGNKRLPPEILVFFKKALLDNRLSANTRNYIANALSLQEPKDPKLYKTYLQAITDPEQSLRWRQYATQHLALTVPYSADPQAITNRLLALAHADGELLSSQAMMVLDMLEHDGLLELRDFDSLLVDVLERPQATTADRIAAMGLLGKREAVLEKPRVREWATHPGPIQRVAIATLGQIGDASDIPVIQPYLNSPDRLIRLAAQGALQRLQEQRDRH